MEASRIVGVLIALILIVGGVGAFIFVRVSNTASQAVVVDQNDAQQLLQAVMDIDGIGAISSPHDLMHHMSNVLTALYSDKLEMDALFTEVIRIHRLLFTQNALALNPFDTQHQNFMAQLVHHRSAGVFQTDIQVVDIIPSDPGYAWAHLSQTFQNLGTVKWVYYLVYEDGWKVETRFPANENFEPFITNVVNQ